MNTPSKINSFFLRILKRNDNKVEETKPGKIKNSTIDQKVKNIPRREKKSWLKRFFIRSPFKSSPAQPKELNVEIQPPPKPKRTFLFRQNKSKSIKKVKKSSTFPTRSNKHDLSRIVNEFEANYISPRKQINEETEQSEEFVKKMVAAFEEKRIVYKNPKQSKNHQEISPKQRRLFDFKSKKSNLTKEEEEIKKEEKNNLDKEEFEKIELQSTSFSNETYIIEAQDKVLKTEFKSIENCSELNDTIDLESCTYDTDDDIYSSPFLYQKNDLNYTDRVLKKTDSTLRRERQPKIVGAFLKKPVEVDATEIDWIPLTGEKLPRKQSFKKLLSILKGKKWSNKGSKLYCTLPQNYINEDNKEYQDSGCDDGSQSSTSSMTSFAPIDHFFQHQENDFYHNLDRKVTILSSFQATQEIEKKNNDNIILNDADFYKNSSIFKSKKIFFEEVPRSEVRLSLGPYFPSPSRTISNKIDNLTFNIDLDKNNNNIEKNMTNLESITTDDNSVKLRHLQILNKKEISRDSAISMSDYSDFQLKKTSWQFPTSEIVYDTPKNYYSSSNNSSLYYSQSCQRHSSYPLYDVPKVQLPIRPKSSFYDDALSIKRRTTEESLSFNSQTSFYNSHNDEKEINYATVKPRNTKTYLSPEFKNSLIERFEEKKHQHFFHHYGYSHERISDV